MKADLSSSNFTAVNFQVVSTAKRLSTCCNSFLSFPGKGVGLGFSLSGGRPLGLDRRVVAEGAAKLFVVKMRVFEKWVSKRSSKGGLFSMVIYVFSASDRQKHESFCKCMNCTQNTHKITSKVLLGHRMSVFLRGSATLGSLRGIWKRRFCRYFT